MESNSENKSQSVFLWATSLIGFTVDIIAFINLLASLKFDVNQNTTSPNINLVKITFGGLSIKWQDITLVIIFYTLIALVIYIWKSTKIPLKSVKGSITQFRIRRDYIVSIWMCTIVCMLILWCAIFISPISIAQEYIFHIILGCISGTICTVILFKNLNTSTRKAVTRSILFLFMSLPALGLILTLLIDTFLIQAIGLIAVVSIVFIFISIAIGFLITFILEGI